MAHWYRKFLSRLGVLKSLFRFLWRERMWWMIPLVVILGFLGLLLFVGLQTPIGPFIYTLF